MNNYDILITRLFFNPGGNGVSAAVKCADLTECCLGDDETDPDSWWFIY